MQLTCVLCKYMFSVAIPHGTTSKLSIYIDSTYHVLLGHAKACLLCNGLYVMCEGLWTKQCTPKYMQPSQTPVKL